MPETVGYLNACVLNSDTVSGGLWHSTRGSSTVELHVYWVIILTKHNHQGQEGRQGPEQWHRESST